MKRCMSSIDEHGEEELHSEVDEDDIPVKNLLAQRPTTTTKVSSLTTRSSLKICSGMSSLTPSQLLFVCVLLTIQFYCLFVHGLFGFLSRLEFLPLLLTSVSCAIGVVWSWLLFYHQVLFSWANYILVASLITPYKLLGSTRRSFGHGRASSVIIAYLGWTGLIGSRYSGFARHLTMIVYLFTPTT